MKRLWLLLGPVVLVACGGGGGTGSSDADPFEGYAFTVSGEPMPYQYGSRYVVDLTKDNVPVPAGQWRILRTAGNFTSEDGMEQSFYSAVAADVSGALSIQRRSNGNSGPFQSIKTIPISIVKGPTYTLRIRYLNNGDPVVGWRLPVSTTSGVLINPELFTDANGEVVHTLPLSAQSIRVTQRVGDVITANGVDYLNETGVLTMAFIPVPVTEACGSAFMLVDRHSESSDGHSLWSRPFRGFSSATTE